MYTLQNPINAHHTVVCRVLLLPGERYCTWSLLNQRRWGIMLRLDVDVCLLLYALRGMINHSFVGDQFNSRGFRRGVSSAKLIFKDFETMNYQLKGTSMHKYLTCETLKYSLFVVWCSLYCSTVRNTWTTNHQVRSPLVSDQQSIFRRWAL